MSRVLQRATRTVGLIVVLMLAFAQTVSAHTGEGVSMDHVFIEIATWALGVTAVIALIVGAFWVRARVSRR